MRAILAILVTLVLIHAVPALAQEMPVDAASAPEWLSAIIHFLQGVPSVGGWLAVAFQWIALISAVATYLSIAVQGFLKLPEVSARIAGASGLADRIKSVSDKILPWLRYLSIFNVQKKP